MRNQSQNMKKGFRYVLFVTVVLLLASCSATKYVPEGSYLLDEVRIQTDNKEIKPSSLSMYVRQNPNSKWFSLMKTQLYVCLLYTSVDIALKYGALRRSEDWLCSRADLQWIYRWENDRSIGKAIALYPLQ